jgi:hypothetical protein
MAAALQEGKLSPSKVSPSVRRIARDVSHTDVRHFATTKHTGLPEHVAKHASYLKPMTAGTAVGDFGRLEGNPNTWNMPMPRYNQAPPAWAPAEKPLTFMSSVGQMGKGLYRMGMGGASAATIGQNGSPGVLENTLGNAVHGVGDVWSGQGAWGKVPGYIRKPLAPIAGPWYGAMNTPGQFSGPYGRFLDNSGQDRAMAAAPYTWAQHSWRDMVNGWNQFMNNKMQ